MLPRLQAEQQMQRLDLDAASFNMGMKDGDRQRFLSKLEAKSIGTREVAEKPTPAAFAAMGIRMVGHPVEKGSTTGPPIAAPVPSPHRPL